MNRRHILLAGAAAALPYRDSLAATLSSAARTRAWRVGKREGLSSLILTERSTPRPGPDEVLIEVTYSALNARDLGIAAGVWPPDVAASRIPLSDGAGRVVELGSAAQKDGFPNLGDRVISAHFVDWDSGPWHPSYYNHDIGSSVDGWLAERIVLPARCLVRIPGGVSDSTACTLPVAGLTAWRALFEIKPVKPGDFVLTLGTGGVSTWGLLLAKSAGARVIVTSSSDEKLRRMRELGADITINYRTYPEWGLRVQAETNGHGADLVLENVGRLTLDQSMISAAVNSTIVMIGTGPLPKKLPTMPGLFTKNLSIKGISNAPRSMLQDLIRAVAQNNLQPVVGGRFDFGQADEAYRVMSKSSHVGKIIIQHR